MKGRRVRQLIARDMGAGWHNVPLWAWAMVIGYLAAGAIFGFL